MSFDFPVNQLNERRIIPPIKGTICFSSNKLRFFDPSTVTVRGIHFCFNSFQFQILYCEWKSNQSVNPSTAVGIRKI